MNVLITGGSGFIGSHLAMRLLASGSRVTIADMLHPYYDAQRKRLQLERVRRAGDFEWRELDLRDEEGCRRLFAGREYAAVVHLAAQPGVSHSIADPISYVEINMKATVNVLRGAGEAGVRHVVFASSSSVYGERERKALKEEMACGEVVSPYAATKAGGEAMCRAYEHLYGFRLTIARFFTVYGPWGRPDMAIAGFIRKLMNGEPIDVYGEGTARDYTYIDDIVAGLEAMLRRPEVAAGTFNLGCGQPVPMTKLLSELGKHFPDMRIVRKPPRAGDVTTTWADIGKARELLGYSPKVSIEEGLERTVAWAKSHASVV